MLSLSYKGQVVDFQSAEVLESMLQSDVPQLKQRPQLHLLKNDFEFHTTT